MAADSDASRLPVLSYLGSVPYLLKAAHVLAPIALRISFAYCTTLVGSGTNTPEFIGKQASTVIAPNPA